MTLQEISDLLDKKLSEKLEPIEKKIDKLQADMQKVLAFVSVAKKTTRLRKAH